MQSSLGRFRRALEKVDLSTGTGVDAAIGAMLPQIDHFRNGPPLGLKSRTEAWIELESSVRTMLGHLEEKLSEIEQEANRIEQQRQALIDSA